MKKPSIHYSGEGVAYMLAGWPVCGTGDFAFSVVAQGNHTRDLSLLTCKKCIKKTSHLIQIGGQTFVKNLQLPNS